MGVRVQRCWELRESHYQRWQKGGGTEMSKITAESSLWTWMHSFKYTQISHSTWEDTTTSNQKKVFLVYRMWGWREDRRGKKNLIGNS